MLEPGLRGCCIQSFPSNTCSACSWKALCMLLQQPCFSMGRLTQQQGCDVVCLERGVLYCKRGVASHCACIKAETLLRHGGTMLAMQTGKAYLCLACWGLCLRLQLRCHGGSKLLATSKALSKLHRVSSIGCQTHLHVDVAMD